MPSKSALLALLFIVILYGIVNFLSFTIQPVNALGNLYPFDSKPFNQTRAEWLAKYWQWVYSIPITEHPRTDATGIKCGVSQDGPVWFLDPPFGNPKVTKSCNIPEGKAIFLPLIVGICGTVDSDVKTDEGITSCAKYGNNYGNIRLFIDGKPQLIIKGTSDSTKDYSSSRTLTDFFNVYSVKDNVFGDPEGMDRKRADGYFAIIEPLPAGNHKINFQVNVVNPDEQKKDEFNYFLDMTYNLSIYPSK